MVTFRHFRSRKALPAGKDKHGNMVDGREVFDTHGSITAACEVIDDEKGNSSIRVGFSCSNPVDAPCYRPIRARGLARSHLKGSNILLPVNRTDDGKLMITETIRDFLKTAAKLEKPETHLGFAEYNGKTNESQFRKWFPVFVDTFM